MDESTLPAPDVPRVTSVPRRILVRLPNWVGDVVMAAPAVGALSDGFPDAEVVVQAKPALLGLARLLPGVERVLPAGADDGAGALLASRRQLRAEAFDTAVVCPRSVRAQLAPRLAGIPVRVGFGGRGRGHLLTHGIRGWRPWRAAHRSRYFGLLVRPFGLEVARPWTLVPPENARSAAREILSSLGRRDTRPLVVLEPGAAYGTAKCWAPERFGALAAGLEAEGADVCTIGTDASRPLETQIAATAGPSLLRAAGRTPDLETLAALLAEADLVVANDTGPMHLAAAVATPVLALFGATDPGISAPRGSGPCRILLEAAPCSPCFLRECRVPGHPCLDKLEVAVVRREAQALLDAGPRSALR